MATTREIQNRLITLGYSVGASGADGVMGRNTIAGIKNFQKDHPPLSVDGIVGPKTSAVLFAGVAVSPIIPPWVSEANRYLGLHEVTNAKKLDALLNLDASAIPWCGAFAGMVIANTLPSAVIPSNPLWALNWAMFGVKDADIKYSPHFGAIAVFKRNGGGHVGFAVGHDKTYVHVLGGNQSNKVSVTRVAKSQLQAYRWPEGVPFIGDPMGFSNFTGEVFNNAA